LLATFDPWFRAIVHPAVGRRGLFFICVSALDVALRSWASRRALRSW